MLHLVFHFPAGCSIVQRLVSGDDIIFFDKSLFKLCQIGELTDQLGQCPRQGIHLYVLNEDIKCRGISPEQFIMDIDVIDYAQFVRLTEKNKVIQTWH